MKRSQRESRKTTRLFAKTSFCKTSAMSSTAIKDALDDIKLVIVKLVERLEGKTQK